mmetsp:Transcript_31204/g.38550  ORF Transcript_31204/g.38550 Transcript_31204/m.38550 type:complete len:157 (+) Transcript_31204:108-578(+)
MIEDCNINIKMYTSRIEDAQRIRIESEKIITRANRLYLASPDNSLRLTGSDFESENVEESKIKTEMEIEECERDIHTQKKDLGTKLQTQSALQDKLKAREQKTTKLRHEVREIQEKLIQQKQEYKKHLERGAKTLEDRNIEASIAWSKLQQALGVS